MVELSFIFLWSVATAFLFIGWVELCAYHLDGLFGMLLAMCIPLFCVYVFIIVVENWKYLTL